MGSIRCGSLTAFAIAAALLFAALPARAGAWEEGYLAYASQDYMRALALLQPLADAGNPAAQALVEEIVNICGPILNADDLAARATPVPHGHPVIEAAR